jgi:Phage integrase family.
LLFHDLRHTAITEMVRDGIDLGTIQEISGHSEKTMVLYYTHGPDVGRAAASLAKLGDVKASSNWEIEEAKEMKEKRYAGGKKK